MEGTHTVVSIRGPTSIADLAEIRTLFNEYAASLGVDFGFQDFESELSGLPGAYVAPDGRLLLAISSDRAVGCVAVRKLEPGFCEMKRLYVRAEGRGRGAGRMLAEAAIRFARDAGYCAMRLDTLPGMRAAQSLYREIGFRVIAAYRFNPVAGSSFMELDLVE